MGRTVSQLDAPFSLDISIAFLRVVGKLACRFDARTCNFCSCSRTVSGDSVFD